MALIIAADNGRIDILVMLLKAGAEFDAKYGVSSRSIGYGDCCHG
jgi:ankyrin repeat protein